MRLFKALLLGVFLAVFSYGASVSVTDVMGREVKLSLPIKRLAIGFYYTDYLAVAGAGAYDNVVGISKAVWRDWTPVAWELYKAAMPIIDTIPDFGEALNGTLSVEKILALEPDVLVLSKMQYQAIKDTLKPLEQANIPIVTVDFHEATLQNHLKSIEIFGVISGQQKRAQAIAAEYETRTNTIINRAKDIKNRKKVYIEYGHGSKSVDSYGLTYSHFMWGALIDKAGGINISDGVVSKYGPSNPEHVIASNPEVVFIVGSDYKVEGNQAMIMGNNISFKQANQRLRPYLKRSGWDDIAAVKSKNFYSGDHAMLRTICDVFMLEFVAKAVYPDVYADIDPRKDYEEFSRKYMPFVPKGTFMLKLDDASF